MDFDDDNEAPEVSEEAAATDDGLVKKLKQENQSLRQRLRRSELEGTYGKDVVELIPEELPISKWEDFATKLQERLPKAQTEAPDQETSTNEPPAQAEEPEPAALAAVAKGPAPGSAAAPVGADLSAKELGQLAKDDFAAFSAAISAKYRDG